MEKKLGKIKKVTKKVKKKKLQKMIKKNKRDREKIAKLFLQKMEKNLHKKLEPKKDIFFAIFFQKMFLIFGYFLSWRLSDIIIIPRWKSRQIVIFINQVKSNRAILYKSHVSDLFS